MYNHIRGGLTLWALGQCPGDHHFRRPTPTVQVNLKRAQISAKIAFARGLRGSQSVPESYQLISCLTTYSNYLYFLLLVFVIPINFKCLFMNKVFLFLYVTGFVVFKLQKKFHMSWTCYQSSVQTTKVLFFTISTI